MTVLTVKDYFKLVEPIEIKAAEEAKLNWPDLDEDFYDIYTDIVSQAEIVNDPRIQELVDVENRRSIAILQTDQLIEWAHAIVEKLGFIKEGLVVDQR